LSCSQSFQSKAVQPARQGADSSPALPLKKQVTIGPESAILVAPCSPTFTRQPADAGRDRPPPAREPFAMSRQTRREFIKSSVAASAVFSTFTIAGTKASGRVLGANETIRVAVAGINGRGGSHIGAYSGKEHGTQVTYLVDPDSRLFESRTRDVKRRGGNEPACVQDFRRALDDKNVDVLTIAAPNHWHAPLTIFACEAGKDVYVEKPASHNIHEGRIAVDMARKHNRIVQHGTQGRSGSTCA
jgi:hypothetical protein